MSDDFLYQFHQQPRPEFMQALWSKIASGEKPPAPKQSIKKYVAVSLATLCLLLALSSFVSDTARATILGIIREIGGLAFEVTEENPFMKGKETLLSEQSMRLEEAQLELPFTLLLPTWVPEGFGLQDEVRVIIPQADFTQTWITLRWGRAEPYGIIELLIIYQHDDTDNSKREIVGPESITEVSINGQPAALVRGAWNHDTGEYGGLNLIRLKWSRDGVLYTLSGVEGIVSIADLIHMAESIP